MVKSPCVLKCEYDFKKDICRGCHRTITEIQNWWKLSEEKQYEILDRIEERKQQVDVSHFPPPKK